MTAATQAITHRFREIIFISALRVLNPADLPNQIIAGVTLAALMFPLNIGYAQVAGLAAQSDPRYVEIAFAQALVAGAIFFLFRFFSLGFLANFLSKAVLVGFISGPDIEVLTSQIEKIMGISVEADRWLQEVGEIIRSIPQANIYDVIIGVGAIVLIRVLKRVAPKERARVVGWSRCRVGG